MNRVTHGLVLIVAIGGMALAQTKENVQLTKTNTAADLPIVGVACSRFVRQLVFHPNISPCQTNVSVDFLPCSCARSFHTASRMVRAV